MTVPQPAAPTFKDPVKNAVVNNAVKAAQDLPDLVAKLKAIDPSLAAQLTGKALAASRSPWGVFLALLISWIGAKYGFHLEKVMISTDPDVSLAQIIDAGCVILGSYVMRYVTTSPISKFLPFTTPSPR